MLLSKIKKCLFFSAVFTVSSFSLFAQSNDIIIKHNGERINAKIITVDEKVTFNYINENAINTLSKNCIKEIIFSSGRTQSCSEKIIISSSDDWEKVIITTNPEDVKCLVRKGDITASANNSWNFKSKNGVEQKAIKKIKQEAAQLKAHIVLLQDQTKQGASLFSGASSSKNGVAFGYE